MSGLGDDDPPLSLDISADKDDPAVLEVVQNPHSDHHLKASALNSPLRLQGAMEVGQPVDHWEFHGTQDELNVVDSDDNIIYMPGTSFRRYLPSLRTIYPIRFQPKERKVLPVDSVGFFSFSTFAWMTTSMWKLFHKGTFAYESYRCSIMESCTLNSQRLEYLWTEELKRHGEKDASLFRVSWHFMRTRVVVATLIYTVAILGGFVTPLVFLPILVNNAKQPVPSYLEGALYAIALFCVDAFRATLVSLHGAVYIRTGLRLRSAFLTMIYRRVVAMNTLGQTSTGQIINMFSNDSARLMDYGQFLHMWVAGAMSVIVAFVWIIWELRVPGVVGVGAFLLFFILQYGTSVMTSRFRAQTVSITDKRILQTKEALTAIKVIKVNGWENVFHKQISATRRQELSFLQRIVFFHLLNSAMSNCLPSAAAIVTFITCFALGGKPNPASAFASLAVFMWCRHGLIFIPVSAGAIAQVKSTMIRVKELLLQPDTRPCISTPRDPDHAVCFTRASFAWEQPNKTLNGSNTKSNVCSNGEILNSRHESGETDALTLAVLHENSKPAEVLHDINLAVTKGKLIGICGPMGSGKSSLLSAVLGQLSLLRGDLALRGNIAYLSQQPWLIKATLRENILFGDAFDAKRYYNAIRCCALNDDLHSLPTGDQTEVAEAGITLSGGQKQRVALARAVYSNRDIFLLDDPLAALDNVVAEYVFKECILGELNPKTVLLVSSRVKFLELCDHVVFMRDGRIAEQGTPAELLETGAFYPSFIHDADLLSNSEISQHLETEELFKRKQSTGSGRKTSTPTPLTANESFASLVDDVHLSYPEEMGHGSISWNTYLEYLRAMGGVWVALGVTFAVLIFMAITILSSWYLGIILSAGKDQLQQHESLAESFHANTSSIENALNTSEVNVTVLKATNRTIDEPVDYPLYALVFGCILVGMMVTAIFQAFVFAKATILASRQLHDRVLERIFHGPLRFFEVTPIGRILNVFSKDLDEVDFMLATFLNACCSLLCSCILSFLMVAAVFPWILISLPPLGGLFLYVVLLFRMTAREVKRRENVSRSPLYSHVNATLTGLSTLHAYEKEKVFENEFVKLQDDNSTLNYLLSGSIRWVGFRLDFIVTVITTVVALLVVFLHGETDPAFAALALVYSSTMSGAFNYTVRLTSETQARFTNVERILRYEKSLEEEGPDKKLVPPTAAEWPASGQIVFENVDLRYRENLPLALQNVSFIVRPNEKVAIVGRTGAGKSSIGAALFLLVKPCRGHIYIDDLDISRLPLNDVRSRLTIIPQDPVLFKGTVRFNLDPTNSHHDEEIWQALAKIHLQEKITSLDKQLSFTVVESGDNFSVGEKQLLCLARAILRGSKILFMDEATASVDNATNSLIHQVLMESFAQCTVLTIAHRLQNVFDYNRVLVLQNGKVAEFDEPKVLAENQSSPFAKMIKAASNSNTKSVK